jgi:uncharacterized protein with PhoU and TrkA domain
MLTTSWLFALVEIVWMDLGAGSPSVGRSLAEVGLRAKTGAWIVAVHRGSQVLPIPAPDFRLEGGDRLGLIGDPAQIAAAEPLLRGAADRSRRTRIEALTRDRAATRLTSFPPISRSARPPPWP